LGVATNIVIVRLNASPKHKFISLGTREMGSQRPFAWQTGYGAFSVSRSNVPAVAKHIEEQESHHRKRTFQEEFIELLVKHGIDYDPKYVFG